jgi:hypothetical protein
LIFLRTQVVGRKAKVQRKNAPEGVSQKVGIQTVRNYVSAAVNLWQQQTTAGSNSFPNPGGHVIKKYLKFIQTKEFLRRRKNFEDRAIGSMVDGYKDEDAFQSLINASIDCTANECIEYCDRAMNLFCHYGILRGENASKLELTDLITREYEQQGPSPCQLVILLLNNGKINSVNKQEFAGMCRS